MDFEKILSLFSSIILHIDKNTDTNTESLRRELARFILHEEHDRCVQEAEVLITDNFKDRCRNWEPLGLVPSNSKRILDSIEENVVFLKSNIDNLPRNQGKKAVATIVFMLAAFAAKQWDENNFSSFFQDMLKQGILHRLKVMKLSHYLLSEPVGQKELNNFMRFVSEL